MAKRIKIYTENPNEKQILEVVEILRNGGIIIYPTDTVYGMGCDISNAKAVERICQIKGIKPEKAQFSFICNDLSHISDFTKPINTSVYKLLKRALPGAFTFILAANNNLPKSFKGRKNIGIRVPNNSIPRAIVKLLGSPIISTSIHDEDDVLEYTTDPELIAEKYDKLVDLVIDGGIGHLEASTVVDLSDNEPVILRQGLGNLEDFL